MSCTEHPHVISPCSDDAVAVGQSIDVCADVAYDQCGSLALTAGQTEVEITFTYEKASALYVFEYLYVKGPDGEAINPVVVAQTAKKFNLKLSGAPTTANSVLYWRVKVPDLLRPCQSGSAGVQYAIVPLVQEGEIELVVDQDYIEVTFPEKHPTVDWMPVFTFEHPTEVTQMVFCWIVTSRTDTGFRLDFQGAPDVTGYVLRWRIS